MSNARFSLGAMALAMALAGCAGLHPAPDAAAQKPIDMPAHWAGPVQGGAPTAASARWWTAFGDARLDALIDAACAENTDLAVARLQVVQARLQSELGNPALRATLGGGTGIERHSASLPGVRGLQTRSSNLSAALSYEVDLWGHLAALRDADSWGLAASESDRESARLVVIGAVANHYWRIGLFNERLAQNTADIEDAERTFAFVQARYRAGAVSGLDSVSAEATVVRQRQFRASILQQRTEERNALAVLFDRMPEAHAPEPEGLPDSALPVIDAGLPASLLAARPDLRAAEQRLRAQWAGVEAERTSLYPTLKLTGSLGTSSGELGEFLRNPVGKVGADLLLPALDWHATPLRMANTQTTADIAALKFRQTFYAALSDVEKILVERDRLGSDREQLQRVLVLTRRAEQLTEVQYRAGGVALQSLLNAQSRRRHAQAALTDNRADQLSATMRLYQALGGAA